MAKFVYLDIYSRDQNGEGSKGDTAAPPGLFQVKEDTDEAGWETNGSGARMGTTERGKKRSHP